MTIFTPIDSPTEDLYDKPLYFLGCGCTYFAWPPPKPGKFACLDPYQHVALQAWVTLVFNINKDAKGTEWIGVEMDCNHSHPDSFITYMIDTEGTTSLVCALAGVYTMGEEDMIRFMLNHGIAPGQRFAAEITLDSSYDYWGEYDEDHGGHIVSIEPLSTKTIHDAWMELFELYYPEALRII